MLRFLFFFYTIMLYQGLSAQQLLPPVTNYSVDEYGGASQNWDVSSNEDGVIFAANNDGLLRFDGQRWQLYNLPNKTIIRSVLSVEKRIYTGSYEEFGYWQKNEFGTLDYTSLTHLLQPNSFDNEEFWQIESYGDGVAFRSFGKVYYYNGEKIEAFRPDFLVASIYNLNGKLLIGSQKGGLYVWNNGQLDNMSQNATPGNTAIIDISYFNDELLIGTRNSGIFKLQDSKMIPWEKERLGKFLSVNELNKIHPLSNTKIVFGTIQGGVLVLDLEKKETANYYRGNGLENNTVLALHHHNGDLWIGLDNGLDKINLQGGISYYLEKTGELGAVYDIAQVGDNLYLGSNTGVHLIRDNKRSFIEGSQGQLWSFSLLNGEKLLANHNRGLFELNGEVFDQVSNETGSYSVIPFIGNQDYFINTTYNGLRILYDDDKGLQVLNDTLSLKGPINKAVFQGQSNLWASHPYKGFYKIEIDNRNKHLASYRSYTTDSTFSAFKTNIYKIKDQIAFSNGGRWFVYNSIEDEISYFEALRNYEDFDLVSQYNGAFWFKNRGGPGLVFTDFEKDSLFINEPILEDNLIKGYENIDRINDSIYYIALNDGYAAINLNQYRNKNSLRTIPVPDLNFFHAIGDSIAVNGKSQEVSYRDSRSLTLGFSAPSAINPKFVYRLNGEVQSGNDGTLILQNLISGVYDLEVSAIADGQMSKRPLHVKFTILPPWYWSVLAKWIYFILILIIVLSIYTINKHKLNKHRRELESRIEKEQERKIQINERNKLLQEIEIKRKELANSTYQAAQRNKILIEVKNELAEVKDKFDSHSKYTAIEQKISTMVEGKNDWKVFEANFKDVNQDFFQNLLEHFPDLSTKDLKLCAYLKMNLSTKEIAPLMAISIRGVEIHRYRLRKKLNINTSKNLSKYLIKNF